jgi:hypothetical protein
MAVTLQARTLFQAEHQMREQFGSLYLLEIEVVPAGSDIDWGAITQPVRGQPRANWQVPYDEQRIGEDGNRWAFFFHYLDLTRPLGTEIGGIMLPSPTPIPSHLPSIVYDVP